MHAWFLPFRRRHVAALLALGTLGCAGPLDPTTRPVLPAGDGSVPQVSAGAGSAAVGPASQPGFYPLRVGNRWVYQQTTTLRIVPDVGEPPPPLLMAASVAREMVSVEEIAGRRYFTERLSYVGPIDPYDWTVLYRQDAGGLYEFSPIRLPQEASRRAAGRLPERIARLDAFIRPGRAALSGLSFPETAEPYEILRLRYPLAPKTRWDIQHPFLSQVTAEVVGVETLDLPAGRLRGFRIRIAASVLGPNDRVDVWYGPSGFLKSVSHHEFPATDLSGNVVGREIYEQVETLVDLRLVGAEVVVLPPWIVTPGK